MPGWTSLHVALRRCSGPGGWGGGAAVTAVTAVEVIVALNQWNMYGLLILSCIMNITVGKVVHIPDPLPSRFGTLSIQTLDVFARLPLSEARNCPSRRQAISHRRQRQPPCRAHSRRSPISTESHHEIGLQTGKCFIFSLQLTLIRRIPAPSGHIALFTLPCSFFIHEEAVTCLP